MLPINIILAAASTALTLGGRANATPVSPSKIAPKVMIISMFEPEGEVWHRRFSESGLGNLTSRAIDVPGLSMLFPQVVCTQDGEICQATVGEGGYNAASSAMALVLSSAFDLTKTYFLLAGIAGVNPRHATIGSVALSRYAVQVGLQYEIDSRSLPADFPTGYISFGRDAPFEYPTISYGTEVFELNENLRDAAVRLASKATLRDEAEPQKYRSIYAQAGPTFEKATQTPSIVSCDIATDDTYYSGSRLSEVFENTTALWTNQTGVYCMSAQEDNAVLEVLVRGDIYHRLDFSRVMALRAGSDFDRAPPGVSDLEHLTVMDQNGFQIAIDNTFNAGVEIVRGIVASWDCTYARGIKPDNYIGDIFGSLGGQPDFGLGSITGGKRVEPSGQNSGQLAAVQSRRRSLFGKRTLRK